jgi:small-conductance mechanosensitive channel
MANPQTTMGVSDAVQGLLESVMLLLPRFLAAAGLMLAGYIVARFARSLSRRLFLNISRAVPSKKIQARLSPARLEPFARVISKFLFWILIFFFATAATETLGLPVVTTWLSGVANYLPRTLTAVLICVAGVIGGLIVRDMIASATAGAHISYGGVLGVFAQYAIVILSILIAIEQLGIDIQFLTGVLMIFFGAALFGAGLAFGLGARSSVSNILASYALQKTFVVGQRIRIGDAEGEIAEITSVAVIVRTSDGRRHIPAKQFNEISIDLLEKDE